MGDADRTQGLQDIIISPSHPVDAFALYRDMRSADRAEVAGLVGEDSVLEALVDCVSSGATVAYRGQDIVCAWGCRPSTDTFGVARPWLLATPLIEEVPIQFLRTSLREVRRWLEAYPILTNIADSRNDVHIKWLKWLGFEKIADSVRPYIQFIRTRSCVSLLPE